MVRKGISEYINTFSGCRVVLEAANGLDLLGQIEKADTLPHLCILDIFMPVLNGLNTLLRMREQWPDMKVLVLTGHNPDFYLIQMLRAGANGYLQKDCSPQELERAIRTVHEMGVFGADIGNYSVFRKGKGKVEDLPDFTENEIALLGYCCSDLSYHQIADKMNTTHHSVDWYRNSLFRKLNVKSRSSLVMYAIQFGLVELDIDSTASGLRPKK